MIIKKSIVFRPTIRIPNKSINSAQFNYFKTRHPSVRLSTGSMIALVAGMPQGRSVEALIKSTSNRIPFPRKQNHKYLTCLKARNTHFSTIKNTSTKGTVKEPFPFVAHPAIIIFHDIKTSLSRITEGGS